MKKNYFPYQTDKLNSNSQNFNKAKILFSKIETTMNKQYNNMRTTTTKINTWMSFMKNEFTSSAVNVLWTFPIIYCQHNATKQSQNFYTTNNTT